MKKKMLGALGVGVILLIIIFVYNINTSLVDGENIWHDPSTNITWQDNNESQTKLLKHDDAVKFCEKLTLNGFNNWRLPSRSELVGLIDYSVYNPATTKPLKFIASRAYWTGTLDMIKSNKAWVVSFYDGKTKSYYKLNPRNVRCVRQ